MTDLVAIDRYIVDHLGDSIAELSRLCAQPSVSAQGLGIKECAALVADLLQKRGFAVEVIATEGHPVVYAEAEGATDKTLLFYNHYDVQPPEPLELWTTPPFEPTVRGGKLYARGVSDDKGHIQCRLSALDAIKAVTGSYPCRIKFVIEGEEETSSVNLEAFVKSHAEKLKADACVWEFGGVNHEGRPAQYLGLRGICYVELSVKTGTLDAHSGLGGSIFPNAAWRLVWIAVPLLTLVVLVWLAVSEYSGAFMIRSGTRNPLRGLGEAARYVFRRPVAVFSLYTLALILLALVNVVYISV